MAIDKNSLVYTIIFSFVMTFAFVFLLALAATGTADIVEQNAQVAESRAVLDALGIAYDAGNPQEIIQRYEGLEKIEKEGEYLIYRGQNESGATVYAKSFVGAGLWGQIVAVLGFDRNLERFTGIQIVEHNETPGLGGRITEDWYKSQFEGQRVPDDGRLVLSSGTGAGDPNKDDNGVDAITGATRTSEAMKSIIQQAILEMKSLQQEGVL